MANWTIEKTFVQGDATVGEETITVVTLGGARGLSAYEVAVINNGFIGTEAEWIASLYYDDTAIQDALALKINIANIINDLLTGGIANVLSAEQGKILKQQIDAINTLLTSDNINLDTVQEIVDAIETVQTSLSTILVNDLTTGGITKALTAEMGKTLKSLIDANTTSIGDVTTALDTINGQII